MSKIERGKIDLTQSKIKDISEALGITPIDLMLEAERQLNNDHK
jgi:transcriptional regulator with XRE-family HTH domain